MYNTNPKAFATEVMWKIERHADFICTHLLPRMQLPAKVMCEMSVRVMVHLRRWNTTPAMDYSVAQRLFDPKHPIWTTTNAKDLHHLLHWGFTAQVRDRVLACLKRVYSEDDDVGPWLVLLIRLRAFDDERFLVRDLAYHVMTWATKSHRTKEEDDGLECVLVGILDGPHPHLVLSCPACKALFSSLVKGDQLRMKNLMMTWLYKASTMLLVQMYKDAKEMDAASNFLRTLVLTFPKQCFAAWPRVAKEFGATDKEEAGAKRVSLKSYECPILLEETSDPVLASDGWVYDRNALLTFLCTTEHPRSPMTRERLSLIVHPAV